MESEKLIFQAGEHTLEPLLLETGSRRTLAVELAADAKLRATAFVLGVGGDARLSLSVVLAGEGAEFDLHGLYVASAAGRADIDLRVSHEAADCISRQTVKGIAADTATGSFAGMVHVASGAQRTDASQRNQNLQLADTAHIFTRPQMEIYADDVRCSHGASVGRLDEEAIYYMRQRGVSEREARRMQIRGFAGEIVNRCPSEVLRETIGARVEELIDRL